MILLLYRSTRPIGEMGNIKGGCLCKIPEKPGKCLKANRSSEGPTPISIAHSDSTAGDIFVRIKSNEKFYEEIEGSVGQKKEAGQS